MFRHEFLGDVLTALVIGDDHYSSRMFRDDWYQIKQFHTYCLVKRNLKLISKLYIFYEIVVVIVRKSPHLSIRILKKYIYF